MDDNKQLRKQPVGLFEKAQPAPSRRVPQITIRGDNNLINLGNGAQLRLKGRGQVDSGARPARTPQWPQQILDAIRVKAIQGQRSNEELCELAGQVLGRAVLTLDKLNARDLARVYEAVCQRGRN